MFDFQAYCAKRRIEQESLADAVVVVSITIAQLVV